MINARYMSNSPAEIDTLDELLTSRQVADYLGTSEAVLTQERYRGIGPKFVRLGRRIRYRASDIRAYINVNTHEPGVS